jgi:hypothetical protein
MNLLIFTILLLVVYNVHALLHCVILPFRLLHYHGCGLV